MPKQPRKPVQKGKVMSFANANFVLGQKLGAVQGILGRPITPAEKTVLLQLIAKEGHLRITPEEIVAWFNRLPRN